MWQFSTKVSLSMELNGFYLGTLPFLLLYAPAKPKRRVQVKSLLKLELKLESFCPLPLSLSSSSHLWGLIFTKMKAWLRRPPRTLAIISISCLGNLNFWPVSMSQNNTFEKVRFLISSYTQTGSQCAIMSSAIMVKLYIKHQTLHIIFRKYNILHMECYFVIPRELFGIFK